MTSAVPSRNARASRRHSCAVRRISVSGVAHEADRASIAARVTLPRRLASAPGFRRAGAPGGIGLPPLAARLQNRRHLELGEGLVHILQRHGGRQRPRRAVGQLSCWVRAINYHTHRALQTSPTDCARLLPRRVRGHIHDRRLPASCLPGHARLRLRAARVLDDRRGGGRWRRASPRPCAAPIRCCRRRHAHGLPLLNAMPAATAMRH